MYVWMKIQLFKNPHENYAGVDKSGFRLNKMKTSLKI